MSENNRYSDEELQEFRELIAQKLDVATREYDEIMNTLTNRGGNIDDEMPTYKTLEEGSVVQSKEELNAMAMRLAKFIQGLKGALVRIENKNYGICRVTGKLIPKERLRAVPHATTSIEGKLQEQKAGKK